MSSWKERIFSSLALCAIFTGISIIYEMHMTVRAQETASIEADGSGNLVIDEALDQAEQGIVPADQQEPLFAEPAETGSPTTGVETDVPAAQEGSGETVQIENIEIESAAPVEPQVLEEPAASEEATEAPLDVPQEGLETKMIPLFHAEAAGLIEILKGMKSDLGKIEYSEESRALVLTDTAERLQAMAAFIEQADIPLETETFELGGAHEEDVVGKIKEILTADIGQVHVDQKTGSIVVTDTPAKIAEINSLMATLYPLNREVVMETRVLQIILNDEHPDGIDWEAIVSEYQKLAFSGFDGGVDGSLSIGTLSQEDYGILLDALDTVGVVRVISENNIVAESGKQQTVDIFLSALKNPGNDTKASDISLDQDDLDVPSGTQRERKIQFCVIPTVRKDKTLSVSLEPQSFPSLAEKKEDSRKVTVETSDGSIVVIGSLFKDIAVTSAWKVPLLGDLPFLGFVFRSEGENLRKTEVIAFLAFTIVEKKGKQ
jgi:type II secretory pathway component GspD/PulD (secretin)